MPGRFRGVGVCVECGFDFEPGRDAGRLVESFGASVDVLFDSVPRVLLMERPEPGVWSVLEYAAHTADAVGWYCDRVELVLARPVVQLAPKNWDLATDTAGYAHRTTQRDVFTAAPAVSRHFGIRGHTRSRPTSERCPTHSCVLPWRWSELAAYRKGDKVSA